MTIVSSFGLALAVAACAGSNQTARSATACVDTRGQYVGSFDDPPACTDSQHRLEILSMSPIVTGPPSSSGYRVVYEYACRCEWE